MFDTVEEAFDEVALAIDPAGEGEALLAVLAGRYVGPGVLASGGIADGIAIVSLVAEQRRAFGHGLEQRLGFLAVVDLAAGQAQSNGTTVSVNEGVDLAREPASETSHAAPFFARRTVLGTRTHVESIITISPSKPAETASSSRSHTPALRQRTNRL